MTWVKLDDQFFGNPKARAAGKDGRELFLAGLCYSAAQLTDGRIPADVVAVLAAQAQVKAKPTIATLVTVGLWHQAGGHYQINGWAEYNESAEQVRQRRERERLKKQQQRRGSDGKYTASLGDTNGDRPGDTRGDSPPSHPVPSSTDEPHPPPTHIGGAGEDEELWKLYADRKLAETQAAGRHVGNADAWKRKAAENARTKLSAQAEHLLGEYDLSNGQLVDALLGRRNVLMTARRRT